MPDWSSPRNARPLFWRRERRPRRAMPDLRRGDYRARYELDRAHRLRTALRVERPTQSFAEVLKYLPAAAYIAIAPAVRGGPQMLSSYFHIRERRRARAGWERIRREELAEQKAAVERRHVAMLTALFASMNRTGPEPSPATGPDNGASSNAELRRRLAGIEVAVGMASEPSGDHRDGA